MNYFFKLLLAVLWGCEVLFLLVFAIAVLLFENLLFLVSKYKRGDSKVINWFDRFVEKEIFRGKLLWSR